MAVCKQGFFKVYFGNKLVVRFKRMHPDLRVRLHNSKPNQVKYYKNIPMDEVDEGVTRLTVGHWLVNDASDFGDIVVTCQLHDDVLWNFSVLPSDEGTTSAAAFEIPPEAEVDVREAQ